jgi:hypothetical protein
MTTQAKTQKKRGETTVAWWLIWITLTIGSFFLAVWFWTPIIAERYGSIRNHGTTLLWIVAVFGSWLVFLIPLMIFMYWKVDKSYEDARIRREMRTAQFNEKVTIKSVQVKEKERLIPDALTQKLKKVPATIKGGHLVTATLKDGRKLKHVFISGGNKLVGIYDQEELTFTTADLVDLEPADLEHPPDFTEKSWLRLDA